MNNYQCDNLNNYIQNKQDIILFENLIINNILDDIEYLIIQVINEYILNNDIQNRKQFILLMKQLINSIFEYLIFDETDTIIQSYELSLDNYI